MLHFEMARSEPMQFKIITFPSMKKIRSTIVIISNLTHEKETFKVI